MLTGYKMPKPLTKDDDSKPLTKFWLIEKQLIFLNCKIWLNYFINKR